MTGLVLAELLRVRTLRSPLLIAIGVSVVVALLTGAQILAPSAGETATGAETIDLLRGAPLLAVLVVGAVAAVVAGGDLKRGATTLTYLAEPRRARATAARVLTFAGLGGLLSLLAAAAAIMVGLTAAGAQGIPVEPTVGMALGTAGAAAFGGAVVAGLGTLAGLAARDATIASGGLVLWNVGEQLLTTTGIHDHLPFQLVSSLLHGDGQVASLPAMGLLLGYLAVAGLVVTRLALPRDLT
jgi:ABC-2 type transport system permease protein